MMKRMETNLKWTAIFMPVLSESIRLLILPWCSFAESCPDIVSQKVGRKAVAVLRLLRLVSFKNEITTLGCEWEHCLSSWPRVQSVYLHRSSWPDYPFRISTPFCSRL